ncbi:hypothetical protein AAHB37_18475 [Glutamicibacter halophytocola]|uniref:hypothetical protein n=1 Tax=Glutamicibacter halophytocola TaxID=1933880 RepID=UPI00321C2111
MDWLNRIVVLGSLVLQPVIANVPAAIIDAMNDRRFRGRDKALDPKFIGISSGEVR